MLWSQPSCAVTWSKKAHKRKVKMAHGFRAFHPTPHSSNSQRTSVFIEQAAYLINLNLTIQLTWNLTIWLGLSSHQSQYGLFIYSYIKRFLNNDKSRKETKGICRLLPNIEKLYFFKSTFIPLYEVLQDSFSPNGTIFHQYPPASSFI